MDERNDDDLLRPGEVAKLFGVHERTLERWVRAGVLKPAHRTAGGHARYRWGAVKARLRTTPATAPPAAEAPAPQPEPPRHSISTSLIARMLGVRAAAVVRAIIEERLPGGQTPGGHYRVYEIDVEKLRVMFAAAPSAAYLAKQAAQKQQAKRINDEFWAGRPRLREEWSSRNRRRP